jgi:soluble epoxide hydrolase / lipid-phosphate phosphatase
MFTISTEIPEENWMVCKPSYVALSLRDCINTPAGSRAAMAKYGTDVTYEEFDTDHWVQLEATDKLNAGLLGWIEKLL